MYDIISKKRDNLPLSEAEIRYFIEGYTAGSIPDYQASALLMAIFLNGMQEQETLHLTMAMAHSGEILDLSSLPGIKVDKHSTGGVGDKTTLIAAPIAAACGCTIAKLSGKGLGHTGGTIDKLESIPGFHTSLSGEDFLAAVRKTGLCIAGQTGNLAPADKLLYALRDVTATVDSIPLIASSIMSKKIAAGADGILLDVKYGSGAFMKTPEQAKMLAAEMVKIGVNAKKRMAALITDMDLPLGNAIGNSLEVAEAVSVLSGQGPRDLTELSCIIAQHMLYLAGKGTKQHCLALANQAIADGSALRKLCEMTAQQGGDENYIRHPQQFPAAAYAISATARQTGYITQMDTEQCGKVSVLLGAGREKKGDTIDYAAGIVLHKKTGDFVKEGDTLAVLYTNRNHDGAQACAAFLDAVSIHRQAPQQKPLVLDTILGRF